MKNQNTPANTSMAAFTTIKRHLMVFSSGIKIDAVNPPFMPVIGAVSGGKGLWSKAMPDTTAKGGKLIPAMVTTVPGGPPLGSRRIHQAATS